MYEKSLEADYCTPAHYYSICGTGPSDCIQHAWFALTIVISFLMYIALAMILLFELQPVSEIAVMSLVATGILISPMVIVGGTALTAGLKQLLILWIE